MLRVATVTWQPELNTCALHDFTPRPSCPRPGIWPEFFVHVSKVWNITFQPVSYDRNISDLWKMVYDDTISGIVDLSSIQWMVTPERVAQFDLIYPITQHEPVFVSRKHEMGLLGNAALPFSIFSGWIWFLLAITIMFLSIGMVVANYSVRSDRISVWEFVSYTLGQASRKVTKRSSVTVNALLVITGFTYVLFTSIYAGTMLTRLLIPQERVSFDDNRDLIEKIQKKQLTLVQTSSVEFFMQQLQNSNTSFFSSLRVALQQNPAVIKPQVEAIKAVTNGPFVHASASGYTITHMNCNLTTSKGYAEEMPLFWSSLMVTKGSKWTALLRKIVTQERGYLRALFKKYQIASNNDCDERLREDKQPLTLTELGGAFAFLTGFVAIAGVLFLLEKAIAYKVRKR